MTTDQYPSVTPGPWEWDGYGVSNAEGGPWMEWQPFEPYLSSDAGETYPQERQNADGEFIARARTALPLAERRIEAALGHLCLLLERLEVLGQNDTAAEVRNTIVVLGGAA